MTNLLNLNSNQNLNQICKYYLIKSNINDFLLLFIWVQKFYEVVDRIRSAIQKKIQHKKMLE